MPSDPKSDFSSISEKKWSPFRLYICLVLTVASLWGIWTWSCGHLLALDDFARKYRHSRNLALFGKLVSMAVPQIVRHGHPKPYDALVVAIKHNDVKMLNEVIQRGADVNAANAAGETALFEAVCDRRKAREFVKILIAAGADVNAQTDGLETPLHRAFRCGGAILTAYNVQELIKAGADIHARDTFGRTPLMSAAGTGHTTELGMLLKAGADVNARDQQGETALFFAARKAQELAEVSIILLDGLEVLVEAGADMNSRNNAGKTAMDYMTDDALMAEYTEFRKLLDEFQASKEKLRKARERAFPPDINHGSDMNNMIPDSLIFE